MNLMRDQFPEIGGFCDTLLGYDLCFPAADKEPWIQIFHVPGIDHWIVASKRKETNVISIFDSLNNSAGKDDSSRKKKGTFNKTEHVLGCISAVLRTKEKSFRYQYVGCQQQLPNDCGLHAIANAVSLALMEDPANCIYDRQVMRYHLKQILDSKLITAFPKSQKKKDIILSESSRIKNVKVYCHCRRIHYVPIMESRRKDWATIQCTRCMEWFHKMCERWPKGSTRGTWLCKICQQTIWKEDWTIYRAKFGMAL